MSSKADNERRLFRRYGFTILKKGEEYMKTRIMKMVFGTALAGAVLFSGCTETSTETKGEQTESVQENQEANVQEENTGDESGSGYVIGVSVADASNNFFVGLREGMEGTVHGEDELMMVDANFDAAKQQNDIEDMIQQGVSIILIDAVDGNAIQSSIEACKNAEIPVIAYNSPIDADVDGVVVLDNYKAGQIIGEALAEKINYEGEVGMVTFNVADVCADRADGFYDVMNQYENITVVDQQEVTAPGTDTALTVAENMLQAYPDLVGMFAINDSSALGCVAAAQGAGREVYIVGVDANPDAREAIMEGTMLASAGQDSKAMGTEAINMAYAILAGEPVEELVLDPFLCTSENAAE